MIREKAKIRRSRSPPSLVGRGSPKTERIREAARVSRERRVIRPKIVPSRGLALGHGSARVTV
jgi:hypothetical protein